MKFCYDFATSPPTYEFVSFLLWLESKRDEHSVEIIFTPGPKDGFRADGLWPYTAKERQQMVENVLMPMTSLLPCDPFVYFNPTAKGVEGYGKRRYGPDFYINAMNLIGRPLRSPAIKDEKLVTITLRESEHWPERNSKIDEWRKAAEIIGRDYRVVIVRDSKVAEISMAERASLYCSAFCNLFISNGPAWLSMALDAPTLVLRPAMENMAGCFSRAWLQRCGMNGQLPNSPKHQRIVWKDDTANNIMEAFNEFRRENKST